MTHIIIRWENLCKPNHCGQQISIQGLQTNIGRGREVNYYYKVGYWSVVKRQSGLDPVLNYFRSGIFDTYHGFMEYIN
jgi:hypothetical protein